MSFTLIIPNSVQKQLNRLPDNVFKRVINIFKSLEEEPYPKESKKLTNRNGYRIRIGDYRIIYDVDVKAKFIYLRKVGHRKDIYR